MKIRFELSGHDRDDHELRLLYDWLRDDLTLRRQVRIEPVRRRAVSGEMGLDLEAVVALVSAIGTLGQLPISYAAWRDGRRPRSEVVIHVHGAGAGELQAVRDAFPDARVQPAEGDAPGDAPGDGQ